MKMKKSLLIVPAMATMLLAAAGSVGGTVAWFSANTTFDTTAGQFAVAALDGNLSCDLAPGVGTQIAGDAPVIRVPSGNYLADASYDHAKANRTVWTDTNADTDGNATTFAEKTQLAADSVATSVPALEAATLAAGKLYWAVTWKMTFKYVMSAAAKTTNLYFDPTGLVSASEQAGIAEAVKKTRKGFRIAWTGLTTTTTGCTGNDRVWAPFHTTETDPAAFYYVAGATGATGTRTPYAATSLMLPNDTSHHVNSTDPDGLSTAVNCLGQFVGAANAEVKIDFVCTAWYEGNDPDVVNAASKDVVNSLALHFFTLPNHVNPAP